MINISGLSKRYFEITALDNVALNIPSGEIFGLVGSNGAGKTTLMRCVMALVRPDAGQINVGEFNALIDSTAVKSLIGYVAENPELYDYLTGLEYLYFVGRLYGMSRQLIRQQAEFLCKAFNLSQSTNQLVAEYSHGMRKKLAIIAAFMPKPPVLLLDEPTNGLDPESVYFLKQYLKNASRDGTTIVFSSHMLDTVEKICHRIGIIKQGRIIACDKVKKLVGQSKSLEEVFINAVNVDGKL
ncbi:ABC transporter ATP-binding protein [candidate division KSB1 bacterium]|nr:ABC transporter ATP-binding protein [candidate division KSB1 bacterium]